MIPFRFTRALRSARIIAFATALAAFPSATSSSSVLSFDEAVELHDAGRDGDKAAAERAVEAFGALVRNNPVDPFANAYLGSSYVLLARASSGDIDRIRYVNRGLRHLDAAVSMDPGNFVPRLIRANISARLPDMFGRAERAVEDMLMLDAMFTEAPNPVMAGGMIGIYGLLSEIAPGKGDWRSKARIAREFAER